MECTILGRLSSADVPDDLQTVQIHYLDISPNLSDALFSIISSALGSIPRSLLPRKLGAV